MVYIIFMLIKPFGDHLCPEDVGIIILWGIAMGAKMMACPAFLYPKNDGMLTWFPCV
jgi:hypothetical protein